MSIRRWEGVADAAAQLASELARRGHQMRVQTSRVAGLPSQEVSPAGVDVHRRFAFRRKPDTCGVPEMAGHVVANALPVWNAARSWKPDVLHVHFAVPTGPVAWMASRLTGVPYVLTAHLGDVPGGAPEQTDHLFRLVKPFTRPVWKDASSVTAVSSHVAALARQAYGISPRVILNGTPILEKEPPTPDAGGLLRLLFTGRMSVQKNPVFLGRVLASMRGKPWKAVFLGEGPLRGALEDELRRGGVEDRCEFRGWVDESVVRAVMKESDLLVMPSLSEGLPVAAIEAAAHGLAICGSAIPGLREVLADGVSGWMLSLDDVDVWRAALEQAMNDRGNLRRRQAESLRIARKFDLGEIVSAYEETLASAAGK